MTDVIKLALIAAIPSTIAAIGTIVVKKAVKEVSTSINGSVEEKVKAAYERGFKNGLASK